MRRGYIIAGRIATPFFVAGLIVYSYLTKRQRARVILTDRQHRVLLIQGIISKGNWTLPGGGLKRRESAVDAARRELQEEVGLSLPKSSFKYLRKLGRPEVKIPYIASLYHVRINDDEVQKIKIDTREIREAAWFARSRLPANLSNEAIVALDQNLNER